MKEKELSPIHKTIAGVQFLFVAFGSTVLVPLLIGIDPSVALLTSGVGTLIFHAITKGKVPIFLGSSQKCVGCHLCVHVCPTGAISSTNRIMKIK